MKRIKFFAAFLGIVFLEFIIGFILFVKPTITELKFAGDPKHQDNQLLFRKQLYVGVLTAGPYIDTRALAVNKTWGRDVDALEFFTGGEKDDKRPDMPVVWLQGVNDSQYPPQTKAFQMLAYMCRHHIENFQWFVRADDDVYIKVDKLRNLLNRLDNGNMIYLGQTGLGWQADKDRLKLNGHTFCMGGPGVIMSRSLLQNLCPYLSRCEREVVTIEEDVEIGRCITLHLGLQCAFSWDLQTLFFHAYPDIYSSSVPFTSGLSRDKHFEKAITLHYAKKPDVMYNLRYHHLAEMKEYNTQKNKQYEADKKLLESQKHIET